MSERLVPTIMGVQTIALAIIGRLRLRCLSGEQGKCTCISGCTEHSLVEGGGIDANEYTINDQTVLVLAAKS